MADGNIKTNRKKKNTDLNGETFKNKVKLHITIEQNTDIGIKLKKKKLIIMQEKKDTHMSKANAVKKGGK